MASTEKLEAFLAEPRHVIVAGIRRDATPHLTPSWFQWVGARFYVSTTRYRAKYAIFRRDVPGDEQLLSSLDEEGRILLAFTPDRPAGSWTSWAWTVTGAAGPGCWCSVFRGGCHAGGPPSPHLLDICLHRNAISGYHTDG